jgi:excisionase family DNA binding protein
VGASSVQLNLQQICVQAKSGITSPQSPLRWGFVRKKGLSSFRQAFFGFANVLRLDIKGETEMSKMVDLENLLTADEVAELLGVRVDSIRKHCHRKTIKTVKVGSSVLISREEMERFRKERRGRGRPAS